MAKFFAVDFQQRNKKCGNDRANENSDWSKHADPTERRKENDEVVQSTELPHKTRTNHVIDAGDDQYRDQKYSKPLPVMAHQHLNDRGRMHHKPCADCWDE